MKLPLLMFSAALLSLPAAASSKVSQGELDQLARDMAVVYEIQSNRPGKCPAGQEGCFVSEMRIQMPERLPAALADGDFSIYYGFVSRVIGAESEAFETKLVNGDLNVLTPKAGVKLRPGETYTITLWGGGHYYSAYYPMPNLYVASGDLAARTIESTRPVVDPETGLERLAFVAPMTDEAKLGTASPNDLTRWLTAERAFVQNADRGAGARPDVAILPMPRAVNRPAGAALDLRRGVNLRVNGGDQAGLKPALDHLSGAGVGGLSAGPELRIDIAPGLGFEAYRLSAQGDGIRIQASDLAGAAYAIRSLAQQVAFEEGRLRPILIEDAPRLPFRGLHIDVARNFHSTEEVLKIVEQMAVYKLNRLHLHLGEDEAWRLEIKALPELAEVGGFRCHDPSETRCLLPQLGAGPDRDTPVNGYFSQADYLEILRAAKARQIIVIPSFDMPGHSRAAVRSMEARYRRLMAEGKPAEAALYRLVEPEDRTEYRSIQNYNDNTLNVCTEATYRFLDKVLEEVADLHAQAGTPLKVYHIGADETAGAWSQSPSCQALMKEKGLKPEQLGALFIERVSQGLAKKGIAVAGWSDGLGHVDPGKMPAKVQSNIWGDLFTAGVAEAHRHANNGWEAVISMPATLYFDVPYAPHPLERGYDWPTRSTDTHEVFGFMPENLAANGSVMKNMMARPTTIEDKTPLQPGRAIGGIQAQIWSETVRSDAQVDYMLFPRLLALAERAWHRGAWEPAYKAGESYSFGDGKVDASALAAGWRDFAGRVAVHQAFLDRAGVAYRLAPPGARIAGGMLEANSEFPRQPIEYRVGGGAWTAYRGPVAVRGPVEVRSRTADGKRASRSVMVTGE